MVTPLRNVINAHTPLFCVHRTLLSLTLLSVFLLVLLPLSSGAFPIYHGWVNDNEHVLRAGDAALLEGAFAELEQNRCFGQRCFALLFVLNSKQTEE